jgi:hypothetical protein
VIVSVPVGVVASVLIFSVLVAVFVPSSVTENGDIEQVIPFDPGAVQLSATVWLNPNFGEMLMIEVTDCPRVTDTLLGEADIEKSGPVPDRATDKGPVFRLMVSVPVRRAYPVGVNVTVIVQDFRGGNGLGQLLFWANSLLATILVIFRLLLKLVLKSLTVFAELVIPMGSPGKTSFVGVTVTPVFSNTLTVVLETPLSTTARSGAPSPLKSPAARCHGTIWGAPPAG